MLEAVWRRLTGRVPPAGPPPAAAAPWDDEAPRDHDPEPVDARLRELADLLDLEETLVLRDGKYYVGAGDCALSDGPFCVPCFDTEGHLVRLRYVDAEPGSMGPPGHLRCPDCHQIYSA